MFYQEKAPVQGHTGEIVQLAWEYPGIPPHTLEFCSEDYINTKEAHTLSKCHIWFQTSPSKPLCSVKRSKQPCTLSSKTMLHVTSVNCSLYYTFLVLLMTYRMLHYKLDFPLLQEFIELEFVVLSVIYKFTSKANLESPTSLTCILLDCGRKQMQQTWRLCKSSKANLIRDSWWSYTGTDSKTNNPNSVQHMQKAEFVK